MVDQPGAGGSRSYKIRGYTRERQSAKPYARPPGRRKVRDPNFVNTVSNFFLKEEEKVLFCSRKSILLFLLRVSILDVTLTRSFYLLQGVIETVKDFFSPAWLVD